MADNRNRESLRQAAQFIKQGDQKSAQAILRDLLKATPNDADAWYLNSFVSNDQNWQIKSLERVLLIAPTHEKAQARLTKLRGTDAPPAPLPTKAAVPAKPPLPTKAAETKAPDSRQTLIIGAAAALLLILAVGVILVLSSRTNSNGTQQIAAAPTVSPVVVTRKPTEDLPTETVTAAATVENPTFVPTSSRAQTESEIPTASNTAPQPTETPGATLNAAPLSLADVGGGTGRILYPSKIQFQATSTFRMVDLRDKTISELSLPQDINDAHWLPDGLQLMVSKDLQSSACQHDVLGNRTPEPCLGFMNPNSPSATILPGLLGVSEPAVSPDMRQIAFVSPDANSTGQLWLANIDGTHLRQLTSHYGDVVHDPAWTADGRFISYALREQSGVYAIRLIDATGDHELIRFARMPAWSPDGKSLVYVGRKSNVYNQLYVADADGTNIRQITTYADDRLNIPLWPVWSPDSTRIAFVVNHSIYVINADGSQLERVARVEDTGSVIMYKPSWQPLPSTAVVTATPTSTPTATIPTATPLSSADAGGGTGRILYGTGAGFQMFDLRDQTISDVILPPEIVQAQWLPDGRQLMVNKNLNGACSTSAGSSATPAPCFGFMNADGSSLNLLEGFPRAVGAALSPDMREVAFFSEDEDGWQVSVIRLDGTNLRQITHTLKVSIEKLAWSPDGRFITYNTWNDIDARYEIHLVAPDGTNDHVLIENGVNPSWSPDGTKLAYVGIEDTDPYTSEFFSYIYTADADGTNIRQLTYKQESDGDHKDWEPVWSPDGKLIAFIRNYETLYVMKADGTNPTPLTSASRDDGLYVQKISWQPLASTAVVTATPTSTLTPTATLTPTPTLTLTPSTTPTFNPANAYSPVSVTGHTTAQLHTSYSPFYEQGYADAEGNISLDGVATAYAIENGFNMNFVIDEAANEQWQIFFYAPNLEVGRTYNTEIDSLEHRSDKSQPAMDFRPFGMGIACDLYSMRGQFAIEQVTPDIVFSFTYTCKKDNHDAEWTLSGTVTIHQPSPYATPTPRPTMTPSITPTPLPTVEPAKVFNAVSSPGYAVADLHRTRGEIISYGRGDANGNFTLEGTSEMEARDRFVQITIMINDDDWKFEFFAPPQLEVGRTYTATKLTPGGTVPWINIISPGASCTDLTGEFTIEQVRPDVVIRFKHVCHVISDETLSGVITFRPD